MPVHDSFPPAKTRVVTKEGGKKRSLGVRTRKDEKRDIKGRVVEDHWTLRWGKERKKMNVAFSTLERWRGIPLLFACTKARNGTIFGLDVVVDLIHFSLLRTLLGGLSIYVHALTRAEFRWITTNEILEKINQQIGKWYKLRRTMYFGNYGLI